VSVVLASEARPDIIVVESAAVSALPKGAPKAEVTAPGKQATAST
jgi:hypothetical protein